MTVLLTGNHHTSSDGAPRFNLPLTYLNAVENAGAVPAMVDCGDPKALAVLADKLILTGGVDIDGARFNQKNCYDTITLDPCRDAFELALLTEFTALKKPVLGICRGMQVINVFFGGDLYLDLPTQLGVDHGSGTHLVEVAGGSYISRFYPARARVNSSHHQAVRRAGQGTRVTALGEDGVIEGIEHEILPVVGVQWHPERMENDGLVTNFVTDFGK